MKLERNASVCMKALPFWIIPYTYYMYYLSLYLMEKGMDSGHVTTLMTISNISALFFSFFAAPIVDRMGRKNSLLVFDLVSSVLPALIFLLNASFVSVALGMILVGMNRIMSTAYYLLFIEDTSDKNSIDSMNAFNIISVGAGILTPLAGIIVSRLGIISAEKLFLAVSVVSMTAQALIRHVFVVETPTGKEMMRISRGRHISNPFAMYIPTIKWLWKNSSATRALAINAFIYVYYTVGTTSSLLFTPYFSNHKGLSGITLSLVGGIYAGATLFTMLIVNPRLEGNNIRTSMIVSSFLSIVGFFGMMMCPRGNLVVLFVSLVLIAFSYGNLKSMSDAVLAMECEGEYGSTLYSFSFVLSALLSIIALQIVQVLYAISPNWMFGFSLIIVFFVLIVSFGYRVRSNTNG